MKQHESHKGKVEAAVAKTLAAADFTPRLSAGPDFYGKVKARWARLEESKLTIRPLRPAQQLAAIAAGLFLGILTGVLLSAPSSSGPASYPQTAEQRVAAAIAADYLVSERQESNYSSLNILEEL